MIKHTDIRKLPLDDFLLRCRKAWSINDKNFCFLYFFSLISIFYIIGADIWINSKGFIPRRRISRRLGYWSLDKAFLNDGLWHVQKGDFFIEHKSIINRTSGSNITMPHLRYLCLQITSAIVQDWSIGIDKLKTALFRNCEIYYVKRAEVEYSDSLRGPSNWGGGNLRFPRVPWSSAA